MGVAWALSRWRPCPLWPRARGGARMRAGARAQCWRQRVAWCPRDVAHERVSSAEKEKNPVLERRYPRLALPSLHAF